MTWFVDASVALKWVLPEPDSPAAQEVLRLRPLAAPDFLLLECANVLTSKVRRKQMDRDDAVDRLRLIKDAVPRLIPMAHLLPEAQRLSLQFAHSAYDCLYLAAAQAEDGVLVTADEEFANLAEPIYPQSVHRLRTGAPKT